MHETHVAAGHECQPNDPEAALKLRLLARWLQHCHERTQQRGQLGMLAAQGPGPGFVSEPLRIEEVIAPAAR